MIRKAPTELYKIIMESSLSANGRTVAMAAVGMHTQALDPEFVAGGAGQIMLVWRQENIFVLISTRKEVEKGKIMINVQTDNSTYRTATTNNALEAIQYIRGEMSSL